MADIALRILISAQNSALSIIRSLASDMRGLTGIAGSVALGVGMLGAAIVGVGAVSVKMAADFQQAMLSNVAHAGLAKSEFDNVSQAVLAMSVAVGRSPTQLAEALYPILSAFSGIQNQAAKSALALDTLKMSFETVAGTTVDGTAVAQAAVGTFNALGLATDNVALNTARMTNLFDVMDKTVQIGNMQWDAYKNVVSKLAISIQGTGITFNESQAALALLTNEGFSAQKASTYLSNTFMTLGIKTDALAKHAAKLGISFDEAKYGPMSLADKIQYLNQITDGNKQKLLALMGNNATALKTFNALSIGLNSYKSNLDALSSAQGALKASFDVASQGLNFQMQQVRAAGEALMITIGLKLLPVVSSLVGKIAPVIVALTSWITTSHVLEKTVAALAPYIMAAVGVIQGALPPIIGAFLKFLQVIGAVFTWLGHNQTALQAFKVMAIALGGVIVGVVVAGLLFLALTLTTVTLLILAIVAPIMGVIWVIQHWGDIMKWLVNAIHPFMPLLQTIVSFLAGIFVPVWKQLMSLWQQMVSTWQTQLLPALQQLMSALQPLLPILKGIGMIIASVVIVGLVLLASAIVVGLLIAFNTIKSLFVALGTFLSGLITVFSGVIQFWSGAIQVISGIISFIVDLLTGHFGKLRGDLATIWQGIRNEFFGVLTVIKGLFITIFGTIWTYISTFVAGIVGFFQWLFNRLVGHSIIPDLIKAILSSFQSLLSGSSAIWNLISTTIQTIVSNLHIWLDSAWIAISISTASAWHGLVATIGGIWGGLVGVVKTTVNALIYVINGMINGVNSTTGIVGLPPIPNIPYLAKGVQNFAGGFAVVGERGPELVRLPRGTDVYPMTSSGRQGSMMSGGLSAVVNLTIHTTQLSQAEMDRVIGYASNELGNKLRAQMGNI